MSLQQQEIITREEVMFFDTDCAGVIHNIAYLRMIETCRTRLGTALGMNLPAMAENLVYPVLTRTEIDYKRPGKLGDWIQITGKLGKTGSVRFWCFEVRRNQRAGHRKASTSVSADARGETDSAELSR